MRNYPVYRIDDFYVKSYREGGLTYPQFLFLYKTADEQRYQQNKFLAAIHGIDLEESAAEVTSQHNTSPITTKKSQTTPMLFGDPEQYSKLSEQERQTQTQKMLSHWKPMGDKLLAANKPEFHP